MRKGGLSQWLCSLGLVGGGVVRGSGPPLALPPLPHQVINHNPPGRPLLSPTGGAAFFFFRPLGGGGRTSSLCVWAALLRSFLQAEWNGVCESLGTSLGVAGMGETWARFKVAALMLFFVGNETVCKFTFVVNFFMRLPIR